MTNRTAWTARHGATAGTGWFCVLCILLLTPAATANPPPRFQKADVHITSETTYTVTATIDYTLPNTVIEALENGVALTLDTDLQAVEVFPWWPNRILYTTSIQRQLGYHIISEQYIVTDLHKNQRHSYYALPRALEALGEISWTVPQAPLGQATSPVQLQLSNSLNINRLPLLLQLIARLHPGWRQLTRPVFLNLSLQQ